VVLPQCAFTKKKREKRLLRLVVHSFLFLAFCFVWIVNCSRRDRGEVNQGEGQ
jgi:hypothetical protein